MREKFLILLILGLFQLGILGAQELFYGSWHLQEFVRETKDLKDVLNQEKLSESGMIWDMVFKSDSSFFQQSNMNPKARLDKMDGTWKTEPNERLTVFVHKNGKLLPIKFFYEFRDDLLILERYDELRTIKLTITMKKAGEPE